MKIEIGPHRFEIDEDTVVARLDGSFKLEHMKEFLWLIEGILREHGRCFTISDFRRPADFPADSRRCAIEWSKQNVVSGSALFGTSLTARVTLTLMTKAAELITRRPVPVGVVATEDEARAWVNARRLRLLEKA